MNRLYKHAAKPLKVLDKLSLVRMFISHVGVALAGPKNALIIAVLEIDCSALMSQLVHAQHMTVAVMLYCKLVGVLGALSICVQ